jgi:3-hydroxyacyl-CoA dehydrogenase
VHAKMADNRDIDRATATALGLMCPIQGIRVVGKNGDYHAGMSDMMEQLNKIRVTIPY